MLSIDAAIWPTKGSSLIHEAYLDLFPWTERWETCRGGYQMSAPPHPPARKGKRLTEGWAAGTAEGIAEEAITAGTIRRFHFAGSRRSAFESELLLVVKCKRKRGRGGRHFLAHFFDF